MEKACLERLIVEGQFVTLEEVHLFGPFGESFVAPINAFHPKQSPTEKTPFVDPKYVGYCSYIHTIVFVSIT
jgi:hypothetical protein